MSTANANAAEFFVDRHKDGVQGRKPVFVEVDGRQRTLNYAELATRSARMVNFFHQHGLQREQRIALLLLDEIEFPVVFWGALKAGVVPVALNTLLSTEIYEAILTDCRAKALFVSSALFSTIKPLLENHPYIEKTFVSGEMPQEEFSATILPFDETVADFTENDAITVSSDEGAFWLYSSGSTGQPKGVRHTHGSLKFTADTYGAKVLGIHAEDSVYSAAKFFFAYGLGNAMTFPMSVGATTFLLCGRPTPDIVLSLLNEHRPTVFCAVPTLYAATVAALEKSTDAFEPQLRRCISAGEALPEDVGFNWQQLTGCEILDGVGSTEMLHIFLSNAPGDVVYGTSGVAVPGYAMRLVNENGQEVEVGEVGELLVNGESAATDYWNQREKSRSTFEGVWTRTGDKYQKRDDGRLVYCGRTDDMFKVSGIWVSPFEVEQALISHSDVLEAAVVAKRDADGLEKPKAFVVLKRSGGNEAIDQSLQDHVKNKIGKWKYPRWIDFVSELPKTATGKIQRFKLRD